MLVKDSGVTAKRKVGIMGGTFDPIHNGHMTMARQAALQASLECVLFMPTKIPPHKESTKITSESVRSQMVRLAVAGNNDFMFSDLELRRTGTTYTADTLQILTREHPECEWYFILGADSFFQLEQSYHPQRIFANAIILAAGRDDVPAEQMRKHKEYLCQKYHARIQLIDMQQIEISSHEIREMIARGHSVDEMLPQAVAAYIHEQRLYLDPVQGRKGN